LKQDSVIFLFGLHFDPENGGDMLAPEGRAVSELNGVAIQNSVLFLKGEIPCTIDRMIAGSMPILTVAYKLSLLPVIQTLNTFSTGTLFSKVYCTNCSQEPSTGPYPEPDGSNPYHPILFEIHFNIIHLPMS
jgi:hypothetical protein